MRSRGGKILTFSGVAVVILGIVALVAASSMFFSQLPLGVIQADGSPGSDALASTSVPGTLQVEATQGELLTLWETAPSRSDLRLRSADVDVVGPDGSPVALTAGVSGHSDRRSASARTIGTFRAHESGTYTVTVTDDDTSDDVGPPARGVVVAEGTEFGQFFGTIGGSIGLVFVGVGGLTVGALMAIGGAIWWAIARSRTRRAAEYEANRT